MANSFRPGPWNPPFGICRVPSRTPGPLGLLDQADPNVTSVLGDTPGSLGFRDWADPTVSKDAGVSGAAGMCAIRRASDGTALSLGGIQLDTEVWKVPKAPEITLEHAQEMALMITTVFEGGKSMNYAALADDFDGQGTSFGLIQWNFGTNSLGPLLKKMLAANAAAFASCFSPSADYATLKAALDANNKADQLKWARGLIKDDRGAWSEAFKAIGSNPAFNRIQLEQASAKYHPPVVSIITRLREMSPTLMAAVEFRSYAALFDLCVQQGSADKAMDAIKSRATLEKPETQRALVEIVIVERGRTAKAEWASDCISRRMGVLSGGAYESKENDVTKKRNNSQFALIAEHGTKTLAGL